MSSAWSPRKFSQAEIDGMRDTEVFRHADSLIMCLEDWDVQVAIAAGKRLSTLPPTVLEGFAPALSRSVVGVGLLHRAQQLVSSLLPVVAPDPSTTEGGRRARATRRQDEGAVIETNSEDNNQDHEQHAEEVEGFRQGGNRGYRRFLQRVLAFRTGGREGGAGEGRVGVGAGPRPPLPYHVFWPAIASHVTV